MFSTEIHGRLVEVYIMAPAKVLRCPCHHWSSMLSTEKYLQIRVGHLGFWTQTGNPTPVLHSVNLHAPSSFTCGIQQSTGSIAYRYAHHHVHTITSSSRHTDRWMHAAALHFFIGMRSTGCRLLLSNGSSNLPWTFCGVPTRNGYYQACCAR